MVPNISLLLSADGSFSVVEKQKFFAFRLSISLEAQKIHIQDTSEESKLETKLF